METLQVEELAEKLIPKLENGGDNKGVAVINTQQCGYNQVMVASILLIKNLGEGLICLPWSESGNPICLIVSFDAHRLWDKFGEVVRNYSEAAYKLDPIGVDFAKLNAAIEEMRQRVSTREGVTLSTLNIQPLAA